MAATNGQAHLAELFDLVRAVDPDYALANLAQIRPFSLENAPAVLAPAFAGVTVKRYADSLWLTDAQPLVDYACSMIGWPEAASQSQALHALAVERLAAAGGLAIQKDSGVVLAYRE
jgi:hypothetical protein